MNGLRMQPVKPIATEYAGYKFRSRLEARWAIFFDACNVKWDYEPEGYEVGDGLRYLPDFVLYNVWYNNGEQDKPFEKLFVECKGIMQEHDMEKIIHFALRGYGDGNRVEVENPTIILENIPAGHHMPTIASNTIQLSDETKYCGIHVSSSQLVDGFWDWGLCTTGGEALIPGVDLCGEFRLCRAYDDVFAEDAIIDYERTARAYYLARTARFEYGESLTYRDVVREMEG